MVNVGTDLQVFTDKYSLGLTAELQDTFTYEVYTELVSALFKETYTTSEKSTLLAYTRVYMALLVVVWKDCINLFYQVGRSDIRFWV